MLRFSVLISLVNRREQWGPLNRSMLYLAQGLIFAVCGIAAFLLRFEFRVPGAHWSQLVFAVPVWVGTKLVVYRVMRLDRSWWRFVSIHDLVCLAQGNVAASAVAGLIILSCGPSGFPRSLFILDLMLCFLATAGKRVCVRMLLESMGQRTESSQIKSVFIYGAGLAGVALLREIRANPRLRYEVRGFIDDNAQKRGVSIQGIRVLGSGRDLRGLTARYGISQVLIAVPSATGAQMSTILDSCHAAGIVCRTVPALAELIGNGPLTSQIRDVAVEDLLAREPAKLEQDRISAKLSVGVALVTGAGGSIGSELCRQIARFHPSAIVGYDISESGLFHLEQEMSRTFPGTPFYAEIGSVQNAARLSEVFERHHPSIVYHAAAYKHVPLMESHVLEAVENNILGTLNVALAAAGNGVEDFVMISSDKAVHPTNVMGATKRLAELVIRSLQNGGTKFVSVRFGNVLGSNGSVVPTFKAQIARGGPVTVTDPEMRRYFMTIPEACQLVLQASTMGNGGEIFVLDMGEPVRIVELARKLILLSGLRPDEDIRIEFSGVRPGEKLYEELNLADEEILPTRHEKIKIFAGKSLDGHVMGSYIDAIRQACESRDARRLIVLLREIVPDYRPSKAVLERTRRSVPSSTDHVLRSETRSLRSARKKRSAYIG